MTGSRFLALLLAACALIASALVAIPLDSAEVSTANIPEPSTYRLTAAPARTAASQPAATAEDAALPRLWLR